MRSVAGIPCMASTWSTPLPSSTRTLVEAAALAAEDQREVQALLDHVVPEQRRVLELRIAGLTTAEIADAVFPGSDPRNPISGDASHSDIAGH